MMSFRKTANTISSLQFILVPSNQDMRSFDSLLHFEI